MLVYQRVFYFVGISINTYKPINTLLRGMGLLPFQLGGCSSMEPSPYLMTILYSNLQKDRNHDLPLFEQDVTFLSFWDFLGLLYVYISCICNCLTPTSFIAEHTASCLLGPAVFLLSN